MTSDRFYPARPVLAASVGVIRDGRILLAARGKPPSEGLFSLPGAAWWRWARHWPRRLRASCGKVDPVFRINDALTQGGSIGPKSANPLLGPML